MVSSKQEAEEEILGTVGQSVYPITNLHAVLFGAALMTSLEGCDDDFADGATDLRKKAVPARKSQLFPLLPLGQTDESPRSAALGAQAHPARDELVREAVEAFVGSAQRQARKHNSVNNVPESTQLLAF